MSKKISIFWSSTNRKFVFRELFRSTKNFVSLQKEMDYIYCVVDLHAITVFQKPNDLREMFETLASFLATGLNPDRSIIFNQSAVSTRRAVWILIAPQIGWLTE